MTEGVPAPALGRKPAPRRRLDVASLFLLLTGLVFGAFSCWLVAAEHFNPVVLAPSVTAIITGGAHLTKREAPRG